MRIKSVKKILHLFPSAIRTPNRRYNQPPWSRLSLSTVWFPQGKHVGLQATRFSVHVIRTLRRSGLGQLSRCIVGNDAARQDKQGDKEIVGGCGYSVNTDCVKVSIFFPIYLPYIPILCKLDNLTFTWFVTASDWANEKKKYLCSLYLPISIIMTT